MESSDKSLLVDSLKGNLVYVMHKAGREVMHSVGILEDHDEAYIKVIPPDISRLENLTTETNEWVMRNGVLMQFADELLKHEDIVVIKDLDNSDEVLRKYVEKEASRYAQSQETE